MAMTPNDQIVTWMNHGNLFISDSLSDLGTLSFEYSAQLRVKRIVGIDIAANGLVHTWYEHGVLSKGTKFDLDEEDSGIPHTVPGGQKAINIREIGIDRDPLRRMHCNTFVIRRCRTDATSC